MADNGKTARSGGRESLRKVSISRIKKEMSDVFYLSDDLVISALTADKNTTADYPTSIDGFTAIIMMTGEATVSIDMQNYSIKPNTIVFFNPDSIIRTIKCSSNAAAYLLAFSKSFVNEIQIDLSTSLPVYMRFGRLATPVINDREDYEFKIGRGVVVREGSDVTIVACGLMVAEALEAAEALAADGIDAEVINMHTIKPLDERLVVASAKKTGRVVTAEEHSIIGGLGEAVASVLAEQHPVPMRRVGVRDVYGESGPAVDLLHKYGLDADGIEAAVRSVL